MRAFGWCWAQRRGLINGHPFPNSDILPDTLSPLYLTEGMWLNCICGSLEPGWDCKKHPQQHWLYLSNPMVTGMGIICAQKKLTVCWPLLYRMHSMQSCNRCTHRAGLGPPRCSCNIYLCSFHQLQGHSPEYCKILFLPVYTEGHSGYLGSCHLIDIVPLVPEIHLGSFWSTHSILY